MTNISIMARTRIGTKLGLVSPAMYADYAVLIPQLLEGLPFKVFAASSIDALVHAVESALSPKATPYTKLFGYKAIEMIHPGLSDASCPRRGRESPAYLCSTTSCWPPTIAGLAFGTAGCAAVHATSYPLGGKYHVAHGESNYAMFTGVLKNYHGAPPGRGDCSPQPVFGRLVGLYDPMWSMTSWRSCWTRSCPSGPSASTA